MQIYLNGEILNQEAEAVPWSTVAESRTCHHIAALVRKQKEMNAHTPFIHLLVKCGSPVRGIILRILGLVFLLQLHQILTYRHALRFVAMVSLSLIKWTKINHHNSIPCQLDTKPHQGSAFQVSATQAHGYLLIYNVFSLTLKVACLYQLQPCLKVQSLASPESQSHLIMALLMMKTSHNAPVNNGLDDWCYFSV